jgi:hypothetical protein
MKYITFTLIIVSVLSLSAQVREFPLSKSDYPAYFDLLGSRKVLMSVNSILPKIINTYGANKHTRMATQAILFCSSDAHIDADSNVVEGVSIFTDRYRIIRISLTVKDSGRYTITAGELHRRLSELSFNQ